jgi:Pilus assembly protein, PilO
MSSRRIVLAALPLIAAALAFWVLVLSPERQEAADLKAEVSELQAEVEEQEQLAASAESARQEFPRAYRRVVVLGKAAPEDDDTSSLLVQLNRVARDSGVDFISLEADTSSQTTAAPAAATPQTPADAAEGSEQRVENAEGAAPTPAPPTEASAATLPIGASIGPAGLPVMKYSLSFEGGFFDLADFLAGLDEMVRTTADGVRVRGRLMTVDGFELSPLDMVGGSSAEPKLSATLTVTTFLTPAEEGVTAGASPSGPAPPTEAQPASMTPPSDSTATASTGTP